MNQVLVFAAVTSNGHDLRDTTHAIRGIGRNKPSLSFLLFFLHFSPKIHAVEQVAVIVDE